MKIYDPNEVINEGTGARGSLRLQYCSRTSLSLRYNCRRDTPLKDPVRILFIIISIHNI